MKDYHRFFNRYFIGVVTGIITVMLVCVFPNELIKILVIAIIFFLGRVASGLVSPPD